MTDINLYLYNQYEIRRDAIKSAKTFNTDLSDAYDKINNALGRDKHDYEDVISAIEDRADNIAFDGYMYGFKDGMRFLMNIVTTI